MVQTRIRSENDIVTYPGYTKDVDPHSVDLVELFSPYKLSVLMRCGLRNCHREHYEGFMARFTNGQVTNIGHICGGHHVENYDEKRRHYLEQVARPQHYRTIGAERDYVIRCRWPVEHLLDDARQIGAQRRKLGQLLPGLVAELQRRLDAREYSITETQRRDDDAIERIMVAEHRGRDRREELRYFTENVGLLQGLGMLTFSGEYQSCTLTCTIDAVEAADDLRKLSYDELSALAYEVGEFRSGFEAFEKAVRGAGSFFTEENFAELRKLKISSAERGVLANLTPARLLEAEQPVPVASRPRDKGTARMVQVMRKMGAF